MVLPVQTDSISVRLPADNDDLHCINEIIDASHVVHGLVNVQGLHILVRMGIHVFHHLSDLGEMNHKRSEMFLPAEVDAQHTQHLVQPLV